MAVSVLRARRLPRPMEAGGARHTPVATAPPGVDRLSIRASDHDRVKITQRHGRDEIENRSKARISPAGHRT